MTDSREQRALLEKAAQSLEAAQFIEFARNAIASKSEPSAAKEGE